MRILWLKSELLHPVDKGGRIRTYEMLRALSAVHDITYLTLDDGTAAPDALARADEYCARVVRVPFATAPRFSARFWSEIALSSVSSLPYALWKYRVPEFGAAAERLAAGADVDVVVCDFLTPAVNLPRRLHAPSVLFQHNVEAEIWRRHAATATNPVARAFFTLQHRRMVRFEAAACRRFDEVIAVSERDAAHFREVYGCPHVSAVPTGVDTEGFRPSGRVGRIAGNVVFTGAMDWMPNVDGIGWFVQEVWPRVRAAVPGATFTIVGRQPVARIRELADAATGVEVTGGVPDVRPYLERASLCVVPLRVGGGTRLKVYEAMGMEVPLVSTAIGAEGLPVRDGEHLRLADSVEATAAACIALLQDPETARAMAARAADYVRREFGWGAVAARFAALCAGAVERRRLAAPVRSLT